MAESHQNVVDSMLISDDHSTIKTRHDYLQPTFASERKSWKKRWAKMMSKLRNAVYPAHLETFWVISMLVMAIHFSSEKNYLDSVRLIVSSLPGSSFGWNIVACFIVGFIFWLCMCVILRLILKTLLSYHGFMFETRGKGVSLTTKIWGIMLKTIIKLNKPSLYSFQATLPTLPVPNLKGTIQRYLQSMRPLCDDSNYERLTNEAQNFQNGIGKKLQRYLILKSWWATNYVSDWWEEYVYLRGRSPLMINSNYHTYDIFIIPSHKQAARAAGLVHEMLQFRDRIEKETLKPIMVQGVVPLCSNQYKRMYNTARVPGVECDKIDHYEHIKHIVVLHKGCYYKVMIQQGDRLFNPREIQHQLEYILNRKEVASHGEKYLGSLTAWDRTNWAKARDKHFASGANKASLQLIESAAVFLVLHDQPYEYEKDHGSEKMQYYGNQSIYGNIYDRWFDKSFQLIVGTNGMYAFNAEHTWADAPVVAHMVEEMHLDELKDYDENGNLLGEMQINPPTPTRLQWNWNDELVKTIDNAYNDALKLTADVDYRHLVHNAFGKGFIKTCRISPDGYMQMAIQLAYYRDSGKFSLTYEASMTRFYREGRTETVRSCSLESVAWVKAMEDKNSNTAERIRLLKIACERHRVAYSDAMCGRGVDRHLFCLYVVSKYLKIESPFLNEVISEPWILSTSQTPHGQTARIDLKKYPQLVGPGGGFGPVARDGYGVAYFISGDNNISFHISSVKSCERLQTRHVLPMALRKR